MADTGENRSPAVDLKKAALLFVLLMGVVSLFADATYEGARSITGPYLQLLGASATVVGIVAGFGELIGYGFRLVAGYISDRTRRYWAITIAGYGINLIAVPLLALAGYWPLAAGLIVMERFGKALRSPAKDAMLSHATTEIGRGWGFGIHEALDQVGAVAGPLIVAGVLLFNGSYGNGFAVLLVPAVLTMVVLLIARLKYPDPGQFEPRTPKLETKGLASGFWIYLVAVALVAAAYADFPIIAYHFEKQAIMGPAMIPIFYAVAMGVDAVSALVCGRAFDRVGIPVLAAVSAISACFAPLVFLGGFWAALLGVVAWGIGLGAQESIMRAAVAGFAPADKRGTAYGIFNTGYGLCWFAGSVIIGVLYDVSIWYVVVFSVALQLLSVPVFMLIKRATA